METATVRENIGGTTHARTMQVRVANMALRAELVLSLPG
jgi:hypothetical protein